MVRQVLLTAVGAIDQVFGSQRIVRSPSITPSLGDLSFWERRHVDLFSLSRTAPAAGQAGTIITWRDAESRKADPPGNYGPAAAEFVPGSGPTPDFSRRAKGPLRYNSVMSVNKITHLDDEGRARMVDVGDKPETARVAVARGAVYMSPETLQAAQGGDLKKGDLRSVAELAGVMAAKRTSDLIPLCHPLPLSHVEVQLDFDETLPGVSIEASARTTARTGVDMEALTAVAVAALTVYDMIKGVERGARIGDIRLVEKRGGQSGDYQAD